MVNTSTKPAESLSFLQTDKVASPTNVLSLKQSTLQTPVSNVKKQKKGNKFASKFNFARHLSQS